MNGPSSYPNALLGRWGLGAGVQRANLWYRFMRCALQAAVVAMWKVRVFDRRHEPHDI